MTARRTATATFLFRLRRPAAGLLLLVVLFAHTELPQLLKLPVLVEHYLEHRHEDHQLSFLHFLSLHYFNGDPHDADYARDMQLPFKSLTAQTAAFAVAPLPQPYTGLSAPLAYAAAVSHPLSYAADWVPAGARAAIWQPPRLA